MTTPVSGPPRVRCSSSTTSPSWARPPTGPAALTAVARLAPEIVLLDIGLPDMSGFDVAERISSSTTVVLVSSRSPDQVSARAHGCGAAGFIAKDELTGAALEALVAATA